MMLRLKFMMQKFHELVVRKFLLIKSKFYLFLVKKITSILGSFFLQKEQQFFWVYVRTMSSEITDNGQSFFTKV